MVSKLMHSIANWKTIIGSFLLMIAAFNHLVSYDTKVSSAPIDLRALGWSFDEAYEFFHFLGPDSIQKYISISQFHDVLYPICYTLFYGLLLSVLWPSGFLYYANLFPLGSLIFDMGENFCLHTLLQNYPQPSDTLVNGLPLATWAKIGSFFTVAKFFCFGMAILCIGLGIVKRLFSLCFGGNKKQHTQ